MTNKTKLNDDTSSFVNVVGRWVYYGNITEGVKLYKITTDGTDKEMLNKDQSVSINVVGNWIYYRNEFEGRKLYKIQIDGTERQEVC